LAAVFACSALTAQAAFEDSFVDGSAMTAAMDPADGEAQTLSCTVMIALSDVMIVSAKVGDRTFQGALIDIEKW
jgi:hypothetical protein